MTIYNLDVDDAIVNVKTFNKYWLYSFSYSDGSSHFGDSDWCPTLREAKEQAKALYQLRMGKRIKRARWIKKVI